MNRVACVALLLVMSCGGSPTPPGPPAEGRSVSARSSLATTQPCFWRQLHVYIAFPVASAELDPRVNAWAESALSEVLARQREGSLSRLRIQGYVATECEAERSQWRWLPLARASAVAALMERLGSRPGEVEPRADYPTLLPTPESPNRCAPGDENVSARASLEEWTCEDRVAARR